MRISIIGAQYRSCNKCRTTFEYKDNEIRQSCTYIKGYKQVKAWLICPSCGNKVFYGYWGSTITK
ncbi:MAG: hypothetical protein IKP31_01340 [Lachnospiraceae bacterium]|nr:hypothetical protein [Lachnospiraceae bacterium]